MPREALPLFVSPSFGPLSPLGAVTEAPPLAARPALFDGPGRHALNKIL